MSDVRLYQTTDDGEIDVEDGSPVLDDGLATAVYLSMFGGRDWWGNASEQLPERRYNCETEELLEGLPATSGNLNRLVEAAKRDLAWLVSAGVATAVNVLVTIPALNRVRIAVGITGEETREFVFVENWKAALQ